MCTCFVCVIYIHGFVLEKKQKTSYCLCPCMQRPTAIQKFMNTVCARTKHIVHRIKNKRGAIREYFRLGMQELHRNNALFQGALGKCISSHNLQLLSNKEYRDMGRFFAMSILQGGPSPQFLSPTVADYLLQGDEGLQP